MEKQTIKIYNLYSRPFQTTKYINHFSNVPVERLTYYPELQQMYLSVAVKDASGESVNYTCSVPETLHKVVVAHASKGRRIAFFTDKDDVLGHVFFGEESHLEVKKQIDDGFRPGDFANPNKKGWQDWKGVQARLRTADLEEKKWGYAKCLVGNPPYLGFKD